jgi:hypothetical protein
VRFIDIAERRARLGVRHHLSSPATDAVSVAGDLVGLHSSDPATVYLSARARVAGLNVADLEEVLYDRRTLLRVLGMRRTMFVVPRDLAAVMDAACTKSFVSRERNRVIRMLENQGIAEDGAAWLGRVESETLAAVNDLGAATARELTAVVPDLGKKYTFGEGTSAATSGMSTRILFLLATAALIVRGRPRGTWLSSQYRWSPMDEWIEGGLDSIDPEAARAELVRRWLLTFGPGTFTDIKWWTGWNVGETKEALRAAGAIEVRLAEGTGYLSGEEAGPPDDPAPWVALLPGLDPTVMGWKEREWYLGGHAALLFDRNGNAGPTVWHAGRIVGGWAHHNDGEVVFALLEKLDSTAEGMVEAEAARLEEWLGDVRLKPRFRSPLDQVLSG